MVPVNCGGTGTGTGAVCHPATYEERRNILELTHGGVLVLKQRVEDRKTDSNGTTSTHEHEYDIKNEQQKVEIEYLLATFGVKVN